MTNRGSPCHLFSGNGVELENSEKLFLPAGVRRGFLNIPYVIAAYEATFSNAKGKYASAPPSSGEIINDPSVNETFRRATMNASYRVSLRKVLPLTFL